MRLSISHKMAQRHEDVDFSPVFFNCWPLAPRLPAPPTPPSNLRSIFNLMSLANVRKASSTLMDAWKQRDILKSEPARHLRLRDRHIFNFKRLCYLDPWMLSQRYMSSLLWHWFPWTWPRIRWRAVLPVLWTLGGDRSYRICYPKPFFPRRM